MPTAFVTGGTGFVGLNLVSELVAAKWRVVALHRPASRLADLKRFPVELVPGDICDPDSLRRALPQGVDAVFHVAGSTALWSGADAEQTRINVEGTRCMVQAALDAKARRFVHTSSGVTYGMHAERINEQTPSTAAASSLNYFRSKRLGEEVVEGSALDFVILSPANIIGPYDRHNWSRMIRLVVEDKLPGIPPGRNGWCHAREVARAHIAAAERGQRGQHYILSCVNASYLELIQTIAALAGRPIPSRVTPEPLLRAVGKASNLAARFTRREPEVSAESVELVCASLSYDSSKAQRELGYRPSALREMVADCLAWMRSEGLVKARAA